MLTLRPYQETISTQASETIKNHGVVLLAMEVRTGKTITALSIAKKLGKKKVLCLTKKKAISSIVKDYGFFKEQFEMLTTNYESIHKISEPDSFDLIICDESHTLGTFPKPSNKHKLVKKMFGTLDMILMSGTPTPESYSQFFHQFYTKTGGPWCHYKSFYRWADKFVFKRTIRTSFGQAIKYDKADYNLIMDDISSMVITLTQKEAGFTTSVEEEVLHVKMTNKTYRLIKRLEDDKVIDSGGEVILADTMVKQQSKVLQLYSGTIKTENGKYYVLDSSKAKFIKEYFHGKKIAIYYCFKAELLMLKKVFGKILTQDLDEFNTTNKIIALQVVSGREGISLSNAEYLVFMNIQFSALSYLQARDRLTTQDRKYNKIYWIFSEGGLEDKVYKVVKNKRNFTSSMYKKLGVIK